MFQGCFNVSTEQRQMRPRRRTNARSPRANRRRGAVAERSPAVDDSPVASPNAVRSGSRSRRRLGSGGGRFRRVLGRLGRFGLRIGVVTGFVYGGLALVRSVQAYATTSPRFEVRSLIYEPTPHVSDDHLRDRLALSPGTNILSLDLEALGERVAADPWVARAVVTRHLPDTIEVQITEHEAKVAVLAGRFYLANAEGRLFKEIEKGERGDLPIVTGFDRGQLRDDRAGVEQQVALALEVLDAYATKQRPRLSEIHLGATGDVTLYTAEAGTQILLGRGDVHERLARYDALRAALDDKADRLASVYVDSVAAPGRATRVAAKFLSEADEWGVIAAGQAEAAASDTTDAVSDDAGSPIAELGKYKRRIPRYE